MTMSDTVPDLETHRHMTFEVDLGRGRTATFNFLEVTKMAEWYGESAILPLNLEHLIQRLSDESEKSARNEVFRMICVWRCLERIPHDRYR